MKFYEVAPFALRSTPEMIMAGRAQVRVYGYLAR